MTITYHSDNSSQSDYKDGAIQIQSVDPKECFMLGEVLKGLSEKGFEVVHGSWRQGKFIRLPLVLLGEIKWGGTPLPTNNLTIPPS